MRCNLLFIVLLAIPLLFVSRASLSAESSSAIVFSQNYKGLNVERAYQLQKAFVRNQASYGNAMIGFKAELNVKEKQQEFGLKSPITGILMRSAWVENAGVIQQDESAKLMVKIGLSFKTGLAIRKPVASVDALRPYFEEVALTIELPNFNFDSASYNGLDVIANNAMANKVILGKWQAIPKQIDELAYQLLCDEKEIIAGEHSKVGEGQWQTLLWMVNHLVSQGYAIRSGQLLFTGGLGGMREVDTCQYRALMPMLNGEVRVQVK